jgi:hypothetical protein
MTTQHPTSRTPAIMATIGRAEFEPDFFLDDFFEDFFFEELLEVLPPSRSAPQ